MSLTVIIPALNEASNIGALLDQLNDQQNVTLELIVADGGSTDDTCQIASAAGARLVTSAPGRGCQMNAGAAEANHQLLLFLHADSTITHPEQCADAIAHLQTFESPVAGHFTLRFDTTDSEVKNRLAFFELKTGYNRAGTFNGDQGLLIAAEDFNAVGGFSETYRFMEDQEFAERFLRYGRLVTLPHRIVTSARRFVDEGVGERLTLNTIIMGMYHVDNETFFNAAPDIYREQASENKHTLDPVPFLDLAQRCLFQQGFRTGLKHCYAIGRYATRNFWQVILWAGTRYNEPDASLRAYDRYIKPVTDNPLGHLIGTLVIFAWFFAIKFAYLRR